MKPFPPELLAAYPRNTLVSLIPCNARTAVGVVAFDCDGRGEHACETCNE